MDIQLVPPHNHHVNTAEHAIAMLIEHFVATLTTVDMLCPLQLWVEFLPQVELHSTNYVSLAATLVFQPTRDSMAHSISTRCPLPLLGQKHWFMTIPQ
jgi:hypothetical protein